MALDEAVQSIIDNLFDGVLDDDAWGRALVGISDLVGASGAHLMAVDLIQNKVTKDESHRLDPSIARLYRDHWSVHDILMPSAMRLTVGRPTADYQMVGLSEWKRSAIFNELALPFDNPYVQITILHRSPKKLVGLSLKTSSRHGPFNNEEAERISFIAPILTRALHLKDRVAHERLRADGISARLSEGGAGLILLDGAGRVLETSETAEAFINRNEGIGRRLDGTLELREPGGRILARWLAKGRPDKGMDGQLPVPRRGAKPLSVLAIPVGARARCWIISEPRLILLVTDREKNLQIRGEKISVEWGLSAREAQICTMLAAGDNAIAIARRLNISINTIRTHLKSVYAKTGLKSQADVVRKVLDGG